MSPRFFLKKFHELIVFLLEKNSEAEVAVACDDDIRQLIHVSATSGYCISRTCLINIKTDSWPHDLSAYLQELHPTVFVDDEQSASLDFMAHRQQLIALY